MQSVIQAFESVIRKYKPDSLYLTENASKLFKNVYPDNTLYYQRFIRNEPEPESEDEGFSLDFSNLLCCVQANKSPKNKNKINLTKPIVPFLKSTEWVYPEQFTNINPNVFQNSYANLGQMFGISQMLVI